MYSHLIIAICLLIAQFLKKIRFKNLAQTITTLQIVFFSVVFMQIDKLNTVYFATNLHNN
jgi:hypothetical protein